MRIQHSLEISAPPSRVWELTIDVEALPDHTPTMTEVTLLEPVPLTVGSTVRIKQPAQRTKVWTITELRPHIRFSWTTRTAGTTLTATHEIVATKAGTRNTLTVDLDGRMAPVVGGLLRGPILKALVTENHAFKTAAEGPHR